MKGSKSSLWLPAGLLEDQDKNFASSVNSAASTQISTYWDAWEDKQRSVLVNTRGDNGVADEFEGDWEDQWEMSVGRDLEGDSLNSDLFFSCIVVLGSRIKLLQVEPTGEVRRLFLVLSRCSSLSVP